MIPFGNPIIVPVDIDPPETGVKIVHGVPRCPIDGSIMNDTVRPVYYGECPSPRYEFDCQVCGGEGSIE